MSEPQVGLERLRGVARRLIWGAAVCTLLPILGWLGTALYEAIMTPPGGRVAGPVSQALVAYTVPLGAVLLVLGLLASGCAWWLGRAQERQARR